MSSIELFLKVGCFTPFNYELSWFWHIKVMFEVKFLLLRISNFLIHLIDLHIYIGISEFLGFSTEDLVYILFIL